MHFILFQEELPMLSGTMWRKATSHLQSRYSFIGGNSDSGLQGSCHDSSLTTSSVNRIQHLEILSPSPWKSLLKAKILHIFWFSQFGFGSIAKIKIVTASHSGDAGNLKTFRLCFQLFISKQHMMHNTRRVLSHSWLPANADTWLQLIGQTHQHCGSFGNFLSHRCNKLCNNVERI